MQGSRPSERPNTSKMRGPETQLIKVKRQVDVE